MYRFHQSLELNVARVEEIIEHQFSDRAILKEALYSPGSVPPNVSATRTSNKDLAQIGNAVLRLVLIHDGYEKKAERVRIDKIVSPTISNSNLGTMGFQAGLDKYIVLNPSQQGLVSNGVMANAVEAIIGAVYLDSKNDVQAVRSVMDILGLGWPA